jgi:hypothetical protein
MDLETRTLPMHRDTLEQLIGAAAILLFAVALVVYQNLRG